MAAECKMLRALEVKAGGCSRDQPRNMDVSISICQTYPFPPFLMFKQNSTVQKLNCKAHFFLRQTGCPVDLQCHHFKPTTYDWFSFLWSFFHKWRKIIERSNFSEFKCCCSFLASLLDRLIFYFPFLTFFPPSPSIISTAVVICFINHLCMVCFCPECILFWADVLPKLFPVLWWY